MPDSLFIIPLVAAIAIGWWLGRRESVRKRSATPSPEPNQDYFVGLNYLLDDKTDEAIESFRRALQVNSDTVPVHLALGTLFRRRGEVERAIELHQNLLARPSLSGSESIQVQLALARDYLGAGLFDRAENILIDLVNRSTKQHKQERITGLQLLTDLYQQQRHWEKALAYSKQLAASNGHSLASQMGHFCCELADQALRKGVEADARRLIKDALGHDPRCVRASLLLAGLEMNQGRFKVAARALRQVLDQDPEMLPVAIPLLAECYDQLQDEAELVEFLEQVMQSAPNTTAMLRLAEVTAQQKGDYHAGTFITEELKLRPSVKGFNRLIDLHIKYASSSARESLEVLRGLTGQLEQNKPIYRCGGCGFSGRTLHWQCPTCKRWGSVKPIFGLEGE